MTGSFPALLYESWLMLCERWIHFSIRVLVRHKQAGAYIQMLHRCTLMVTSMAVQSNQILPSEMWSPAVAKSKGDKRNGYGRAVLTMK